MKTEHPMHVVLIVLACLAAGALLTSCGSGGGRPQQIILISMDTCRADHLGCYGFRGRTTPNLDRLAQEAVLCTNVISPVPMTLPAHSSMLSGTIPPTHGVRDNQHFNLGDATQTLPELLKPLGYRTAAFVSSVVIRADRGLEQGFDSYDDQFRNPRRVKDGLECMGGEITQKAVAWLRSHREDSFFLFLHYYDPHEPYEPPHPYSMRFGDDLYAGEIAYTDDCIGRVITELQELELYDDCLLIITGDHGEMLGEHGEAEHAYFIYQAAIHVPLIFKLPGGSEGRRIERVAGLVDIVPTVCGMVGIDPPGVVRGEDLSPWFNGDAPPEEERLLYCESLWPTRYEANPLLGVVTDRWKYIRTTRPELYDLNADPAETRNLASEERQRATVLNDRLLQIIDEATLEEASSSQAELDAETQEQLASLGYIGGDVSESMDLDPTKEDPKDLIGIHATLERAYTHFFQEEYAEAEAECRVALDERPDLSATVLCMADILSKSGRLAEAVEQYEAAIRLGTESGALFYDCGNARQTLGDLTGAIADYTEAIRLKPDYCPAYVNRGVAESRLGNVGKALDDFDRAIAIDPKFANAYLNRSRVRMQQRDFAGARADLDAVISLNPRHAMAYLQRSRIRAQQGDQAGARSDYEQAVRLRPDLAQPRGR